MMIGRRTVLRSALALAVSFAMGGCTADEAPPPAAPLAKGRLRVAVVSIVEIDPIAQLRDGFKDAVGKSDLNTKFDVEYTDFNAQGDNALVNQVADSVATGGFDAAYVLGTPLAQAIQARSPDLLVVQGAVTDPVSAGLANSWERSGKKYVATSDLPAVGLIVDLVTKLWPNEPKVGIIYNQGEVNSAAVVKRLRDAAGQKVAFEERPVSTAADIATAVRSLKGRAQVIYVPPDNVVVAGGESLLKLADEERIPVLSTSADLLKFGAMAAFETDYRQLGAEAGDLFVEVISGGADPAALPIHLSNSGRITIAKPVAAKFGVDLNPLAGLANFVVSDERPPAP